jgi:hypothetical protein
VGNYISFSPKRAARELKRKQSQQETEQIIDLYRQEAVVKVPRNTVSKQPKKQRDPIERMRKEYEEAERTFVDASFDATAERFEIFGFKKNRFVEFPMNTPRESIVLPPNIRCNPKVKTPIAGCEYYMNLLLFTRIHGGGFSAISSVYASVQRMARLYLNLPKEIRRSIKLPNLECPDASLRGAARCILHILREEEPIIWMWCVGMMKANRDRKRAARRGGTATKGQGVTTIGAWPFYCDTGTPIEGSAIGEQVAEQWRRHHAVPR